MPSIKTITPLQEDSYYHIFNRGNNRQQVFFTEDNYKYFLKLFDEYMSSVMSLLAYCLVDNHFHLLVKVHDEKEIHLGMSSFSRDDIPKRISNQFRSFFISYSMAINKQENLCGNLFDRPFKRLEIDDEDYLLYVAFYIHYNPQKHGLTDDFRNYKFSSWKAYNSNNPTKLNRKLLFELFGGKQEFLEYHKYFHEEKENFILE